MPRVTGSISARSGHLRPVVAVAVAVIGAGIAVAACCVFRTCGSCDEPPTEHAPEPVTPPAYGFDEFEFGQKLAQKGMFDFAKKVYQRMLADPNAPAGDRERARYGMAILGREEARTFASLPDSSWADVKARYEAAAGTMQDFVNRHPDDPRIDQVRMELGNLYLQIVEWINEHVNPDETDPHSGDPVVDDFLRRRETTRSALLEAAQGYVDEAVALFEVARRGAKEGGDREMGAYYAATSLYFRGAVYPPCSAEAISAYDQAIRALEDYATANEERLTGSYAMDFAGLSGWELAKCQTDPRERLARYARARTWFEACASIENQSIDHLMLIMRGYYHLAQMCLEAGRQDGQDFWKLGSAVLVRMEKMKDSTKVPRGCRAYLEWARIEAKQGRLEEAVRIAKIAAEAAKASAFAEEERLARETLSRLGR